MIVILGFEMFMNLERGTDFQVVWKSQIFGGKILENGADFESA